MSNTETQPFLIDAEAAKALYKDLRDRIDQIPPPVDPSVVIDDTSESATDKTWSVAKIVEEQNKKAPIIIDSKSGNPIVIDDGVPGLKLYDMKVSFLPKQAGFGDPSPTNIRPITGWTGIKIGRNNGNFLPKPDALTEGWTNTLYGVTAVYSDGYLNVTGTSDPENGNWSNVVSFNTAFSSNPILLPPGDYAMPQGMTICITQNGASENKASPFTLTENANLVGFYVAVYKDTQVNLHIPLTVVAGTERPTEYINQEASVYPVSWQTEAGTVYGGTFDVLTGVLTVEWVPKTVRWGDVTRNPPGESMTSGYIALDYETKIAGESGVSNEHKCNAAVWIWSGEANTTPHFYVYRGSSGKCTILVILPNGTDEDLNIVVVSKLKEPYTVQLNPVTLSMLIGTNTIWTDADGIEIAYPVDTKKYIDAGASDVKDVQVDGTSIVSGGVANFRNAAWNRFGVVKPNPDYGVGAYEDNAKKGILYLSTPTDAELKAGTSEYKAIKASNQHKSAFYALAKLAGYDLKNETVTLGQYPDAAKVAIQKMLGVYQAPWELIREDSFTNAESADVTINTDDHGNSFELIAIRLLVWTPSQETVAVIGSWGEVVFSKSGIAIMSSNISNAQTRTVNPSDSRIIGHISIENEGGMAKLTEYRYTTLNGEPNITMKAYMDSSLGYYPFRMANDFAIDKVRIKSITGTISVRLYGKRKWT